MSSILPTLSSSGVLRHHAHVSQPHEPRFPAPGSLLGVPVRARAHAPRASPLTAQVRLRLAKFPRALHVEAQQGLLQVPRAASTHEVPEGATDTLPTALHREGTQAQLPALEVVEGGGWGEMELWWAGPGLGPCRGGDSQPGPESGPRKGGWTGETNGATYLQCSRRRKERPRRDRENLLLGGE